jgi:Tol biopolymer transport system component/imidazolonepropionase-like amidohydrolase
MMMPERNPAHRLSYFYIFQNPSCMHYKALLVILIIIPAPVLAQKQEAPQWDVSNPPGNYREVRFTTDEGTWMNLDVSPDGRDIVFDLLGDIYIIPVTGGEARLLRGGIAFEVQPRFSADGKFICFTSDAGGGDNVWIMNRDGSAARQVTKEDFRLLNNAVWSPDGDYLVARKHFTSARSLGAGELWMYHRTGGEGVQLTKRKNDQQDLGEPCYSPDGKYIYYSEDMYPGGYFQYNKDPNTQIYVIRRFDTQTGETEMVTGGAGGAVRPQVSRDGKKLAFVRRVREQSVLFIRDLGTGEEWPVYDALSKDQQEAWAIFGVYPNFNWMPGDREIVIWSQGKLRRIQVQTGISSVIPFTANCVQKIADAVRFTQEAAPDSFEVKAIRHTVTSPDGSYIVFNAAGRIWKKMLPTGKPERLTASSDNEFEPAFSSDGKKLVYVSWNDENYGAIQVIDLRKKGSTPVKITSEKGIFRTPSFSPDGSRVVFVREGGNDAQGFAFSVKPGIYTIPSGGGDAQFMMKDGQFPSFSADGNRIYYFTQDGDKKALKSRMVSGVDELTHLTSKYATSIMPSPDNKWVAFTELFKVYVAPFLPSGKTMELASGGKAFPVAHTARDNGLSLHWSPDSKNICWTSGDQYFSTPIQSRFTFLEGSPDSVGGPDTTGTAIGLRLSHDKPEGKLAFTGARIITMNGSREVIVNGTIVVDRNRITAIGKTGAVQIPAGARVIDVNGKTIMPGIIDVHAHLGTFRQGLSPQKQWSYYANLAYGVTTTHDPSSNSEMTFSQSEMVKAGLMTGPRIFSTGWILYGAEGDFKAVINKREDALSAIRRTTAFGAFSVKSYNQPRRDQRQMVLDAARELRVNVVPEGGSFFFHNLSMIIDGHTGIEHNLPVAPLYNDVQHLWANSKTGYTPTLIVCYGGIMGEQYFYQKTNVWENEKLLRFTPRFVIDTRSRHRTMIPDKEYDNGFIEVSRACKALADRGVKVNLGAHGQLQGLGAHWELWMLSQGGMTNMQALECATVNGAYYIGMENDLGSLEAGKLADFIILEKNPLDDIRNSESILYTIANGRMYDASNMDESGNHERKRSRFYWEQSRSGVAFPWHQHTHGDED